MNDSAPIALAAFVLVATGVALAGRARSSTTTLDFYLAGRRVGMVTNAWAICGDYFSAASFLGVAAAVYAAGLDGVWYATGFAAGFVPVLLFVAAPLRRFGHVTIPDFLGRRFASERVRAVAVLAVEAVVLSYLIPQAVASGLTWEVLVGRGAFGMSPYATGVIVAAVLVAGLVVVGGMRGTTWNQALQFLLLLTVLFWLAIVVVTEGFSYPDAVAANSAEVLTQPDRAGELAPVTNQIDPDVPARFGMPGGRYGPLGQFALLVTLVLGTCGLPHVMNRYFTSPSGRAARLTTVWVLGFAGIFYALAVMLGTAARSMIADAADEPWLSDLVTDGVLEVPEHALLALGRLVGGLSGLGLVATAAFAAMVSTIGGLLLAAAASWGHDVHERFIRPRASQREAVLVGRLAVVVASLASALIALAAEPLTRSVDVPSIVASMVTWAFALAGSSLTPSLLLSIWWKRTTATGVIAGIVTGGVIAFGGLLVGLTRGDASGTLGSVLLAPTILAAPMSTLAVVLGSLRTELPAGLDAAWTKMHGTASDRSVERLARATVRGVRT